MVQDVAADVLGWVDDSRGSTLSRRKESKEEKEGEDLSVGSVKGEGERASLGSVGASLSTEPRGKSEQKQNEK